MKPGLLLALLCLVSLNSFTQDASQTLHELINKMNSVVDYSADAVITSDIPMIKIMSTKATIYFKQKDKFKIDAKGIAILPKQGFTDISKLLAQKDSYTSVMMGNETVSNVKTDVISVFPVSDTTDLVLAKLWIDPSKDVVMKSQITTRSSGTVTIMYIYASQIKWGLPDQLVFIVDVKKFKIPKGVATDINKTSTTDQSKTQAKTGEIKIDLSNYKVNLGIKDAVFEK